MSSTITNCGKLLFALNGQKESKVKSQKLKVTIKSQKLLFPPNGSNA